MSVRSANHSDLLGLKIICEHTARAIRTNPPDLQLRAKN
jgi:hypothetical protein